MYAQDEYGNDIAVGVFVTEHFVEKGIISENMKEENVSASEITDQPNITWVAAVEECPTAVKENETEIVSQDPMQPIPEN